MRSQPIVQFSDFQFDLAARLLTHGSRRLELSPKALEILAILVKNVGRVVSKDDLLDTVWPSTVVEEGNLAVHIFSLRRALGQDASTAAYIETIPKRGYRFAAPVSPVPENGGPTSVNQPYDLCGIAGHHLEQQSPGGCRRAAAVYRKCIANEPRNLTAVIGLANTLLFRFVLGDLSEDQVVPRVQMLLRKANEIDHLSAELHLSQSRLLRLCDWQWERAEDELQRALENANSDEIRAIVRAWHGSDLAGQGDLQTGLEELRRCSEDFPLSTYIWRMLADAHFLARDFQVCVAVSRKALQLHPSCGRLHRVLGKALTALGEYGPARRSFRRAGMINNGRQIDLLAEIAYLDAVAGNRDSAVALLSRLQRHPRGQLVSRVLIAEIYAGLGNKQRALEYVEEACFTRDWASAGLKQNSRLDPIRHTPQYQSVLARVGI